MTWRRLAILAACLLAITFYGCAKQGTGYRTLTGQSGKTYKECQRIGRYAVEIGMARLQSIQKDTRARGFITNEELDEVARKDGTIPNWGKCYNYFYSQREYARPMNCPDAQCGNYYSEFKGFLREIAEQDLLPFRAMFFLALEQENYEEAEIIRIEWLSWLLTLKKNFKTTLAGMPMARLDLQIDKLTSVVGLTDPMLIKLRKKLAIAMDKDNWDAAQKIQSIITARTNELRPQQPQGHEVQQVVRYGATDIVRAMNAMEGRTMTREESGAAKMLDIILGR